MEPSLLIAPELGFYLVSILHAQLISINTCSDIPAGGALDIQIPTQACRNTEAEISKLEHVVLTLSFIHRRRGDVSVLLTSPSGTKNEMLSTRRYDDSKEGLDNWGFMTVHCWGNIHFTGIYP